ncbi:5'-nucleotidase domain-containing protein 1 [Schistocerca serialis cubense]|uniref:5'-nucleotidase domain-containing protein 1 n=1 Tax=Schistocerca serialis cubense TaxID=2023355 RepID=UPI00214F4504|nr:5'-nucleotidase domain-containing protein 1 [Schistocerca serialis cubense]
MVMFNSEVSLKISRVFSVLVAGCRFHSVKNRSQQTQEAVLPYVVSVSNYKRFGTHICDICSNGRMSASKMTEHNYFKFTDYDWIGFDLDNTLCKYNVENMMKMEYDVLSRFLVDCKSYPEKHLFKPVDDDFNYIRKGVMIDFDKGNVLQIGKGGKVLRACHGTRMLTNNEIIKYYGQDRMWKLAGEFYEDILGAWNGPLSLKLRTVLDSFDMPASLAFARIIDTLDEKEGRELDKYNVWPDVLDGLYFMYQREHFSTDTGGYFPSMKSAPEQYIYRCSDNVTSWLKSLKKQARTFLLTGSNVDFASFVARNSLGEMWVEFFDVVVCFARKPGFFTASREFVATEDGKETVSVTVNDLQLNKVYSQGNWKELRQVFSKTVGKQNPRCLYVGDNLIQDIYVPSKYVDLDTVAVVDNMLEEEQQVSVDSSRSGVSSSRPWASYFGCESHGISIWSDIICKHSKICVPSIDVLANRPVDYLWTSFRFKDRNCREHGFHPVAPIIFR